MKNFECACGASLFFDNTSCLRCGRVLGYAPHQRQMLSASADSSTGASSVLFEDSDGNVYRQCDNGLHYAVCNWLVEAGDSNPLCLSCRLNRTIPNLENEANIRRWAALEASKRRLIWELLALGLPFPGRSRISGATLRFEFLEDQRTNPTAYLEHVSTGHLDGVITINVAEADDVLREKARTDLDESVRTLLGHFRHEIGHYYWGVLIAESSEIHGFRDVFGDERIDYAAALDAYYAQPERTPAGEDFVSDYARCHPLEDWADTWAHYMHMWDALDTARSFRLTEVSIDDDFETRLAEWRRIAIMLNEMTRSVGARDAYPFALGMGAARKLRYIDECVRALHPNPRPAEP